MGNLCNDNSKETSAYEEFLKCNNVLILTLPSRFLFIVDKYKDKRPDQNFSLYTDVKQLTVAKADCVLVDNTTPAYYDFALAIKGYVKKDCKFFVLVDNRYITDLKVHNKKSKYRTNGKK